MGGSSPSSSFVCLPDTSVGHLEEKTPRSTRIAGGGKFRTPASAEELDGCEGSQEEFRAIAGSFDFLAGEAGDESLAQKCLDKGERLFNQKTKPIHFQNQARASPGVRLGRSRWQEHDRGGLRQLVGQVGPDGPSAMPAWPLRSGRQLGQ